jgi:hypothetical protein
MRSRERCSRQQCIGFIVRGRESIVEALDEIDACVDNSVDTAIVKPVEPEVVLDELIEESEEATNTAIVEPEVVLDELIEESEEATNAAIVEPEVVLDELIEESEERPIRQSSSLKWCSMS